MRHYSPYPAYRNSGIDWLGEIPAHWGVSSVRRHFNVELGKMLNRATEDGTGVIKPYMRAANVHWNGIKLAKAGVNEMEFSHAQLARYRLRPDDLLVTEGGVTVGRSTIWNGEIDECCYQNSLNRARTLPGSPLSTKYLHYWMYFTKMSGYVDLIAEKATFGHLTNEKLLALQILVPGSSEQHAIAGFLDRETARIDALIAKKQRLIELLQEKRTALISHAVTKGLDAGVAMKPIDGDWIEEIPVGWRAMPLKRWVETKITDGPHETPEFVDEGIPFVSAESMKDGRIDFSAARGNIPVEFHKRYSKKLLPRRDDIFICKSGATTGKLARVDVDFEFSVWSPLALVRANRALITSDYLFLALQSEYVQKQIQRGWSAGTQPNISMGEIELLQIVAPNLGLQEKIIAGSRSEIDQIARLVAKAEQGMTLLHEYRTALISAAVTGKIDVRAAS